MPLDQTEPDKASQEGDPFTTGDELKLVKTDKKQDLNQIFSKLHELWLSDRISEYERYILQKYSVGIKDLNADQIRHQLENLERCKSEPDLLERLENYLVKLAA